MRRTPNMPVRTDMDMVPCECGRGNRMNQRERCNQCEQDRGRTGVCRSPGCSRPSRPGERCERCSSR